MYPSFKSPMEVARVIQGGGQGRGGVFGGGSRHGSPYRPRCFGVVGEGLTPNTGRGREEEEVEEEAGRWVGGGGHCT